MRKLNTTALAAGASTLSLEIRSFGRLAVAYVGDLDNETISMEMSVDGGTTWLPCFPGDSASTQETYTNATSSIRTRLFWLPGGTEVRWTASNGGGTLAGVYVMVDGETGSLPNE